MAWSERGPALPDAPAPAPTLTERLIPAVRPLQATTAALLSAGIITAALASTDATGPGATRRPLPSAQSQLATVPPVVFSDRVVVVTPTVLDVLLDEPTPPIEPLPADPPAGDTAPTPPPAVRVDPPAPPPPPAVPLAQITVVANAGPAHVGASAGVGGGSCTGATVNGTTSGCAGQASGGTARVTTGGSLLGDRSVGI